MRHCIKVLFKDKFQKKPKQTEVQPETGHIYITANHKILCREGSTWSLIIKGYTEISFPICAAVYIKSKAGRKAVHNFHNFSTCTHKSVEEK